nr:hypothetical protein [Tanacetum cinerariifolium]
FYTSSDDEDEVNSELAAFMEACQAAYEASKPKLHRTPVKRDHYDAHDRLVMAYFSEHLQYDEATFHEVNSELAAFMEACQAAYEASKPKLRRTPVEMDHYDAHDRLVMVYFSEHLQYDEATFQRYDCMGQRSISALMKYTSVIRQMAYGAVPDSFDKYLQIGATTARDSLRIFCE